MPMQSPPPVLQPDAPPVSLARVIGAGPAHFVKNLPPGCPSLAPVCKLKPYVLPGDRVVTSDRSGNYMQATFQKGRTPTSGWLSADRLQIQPADPHPPLSAWAGDWRRYDDHIAIRAGPDGTLRLDGDAYYPSAHPSVQQRPGGPNLGELGGAARVQGATATYSDGDDSFSCRVTLRLIGPYLAAADNNNCGGHNVSFTGVWTRPSGPGR